MRDRARYARENRNNPDSTEQMHEHPYDFVRLPQTINRNNAITPHNIEKTNLLTGRLIISCEIITPLHIGSGNFIVSKFQDSETIVKEFAKSGSREIIPGSSLKGSIRSIFEAVTMSCCLDFKGKQRYGKGIKLPEVIKNLLRNTNDYNLELSEELKTHIKKCIMKNNSPLCPACSLFGAMGYLSRLKFNDAVLKNQKMIVKEVKESDQPQLHRAAQKIVSGKSQNGKDILIIKELEGRKFYYDTSNAEMNQNNSGNELYECADKGALFEFEVIFQNISPEELGGFLWSAGINNDFNLRIGGLKSKGYGLIKTNLKELKIKKGLNEISEPIENKAKYIDKFINWPNFYSQGQKEVIEITKKVKI